jgi:regulator of replication initiation timing
VVSIPGLETKQVAGTDRQDWLVMTPDPQLWKAAIARKTEAGEAAKAALQEASQVRQESAQMSAEQERLRAEMEALKQELHTIRQTPAAVPVVSQPHQAEPTDSIKNRLRQLQDLRNENLISEDEYQAKRQEILDSL